MSADVPKAGEFIQNLLQSGIRANYGGIPVMALPTCSSKQDFPDNQKNLNFNDEGIMPGLNGC
jgi:hypothetical protein